MIAGIGFVSGKMCMITAEMSIKQRYTDIASLKRHCVLVKSEENNLPE